MSDKIESSALAKSGTMVAVMLLIQLVILPGLAWMLVKLDAMQKTASRTNMDVAVFSDRQMRLGADINDIKTTLKGVETQDAAQKAHQRIWDTDKDQYKRLDLLYKNQQQIDARVKTLEKQR